MLTSLHSHSILPVGYVNFKTAKLSRTTCDVGSTLWELWEEDATSTNMIVSFENEVWNGEKYETKKTFKLIHTCGEGDGVGKSFLCHHDQTQRGYGEATVIAQAPHTAAGLLELGKHVKLSSIPFSTYK